ncbi:aminotransferase class III-fold pyridoxal phosphate-dependent enzyme [Citricoccus sp.]|uniref:aspartate aminotransferase family protein n=1 Tax=Citricoccus sp. TaxID=1978372 RepID=UPI0028BEE4A4|nr:aminotransferase class III-fold pyridoxal phosphate-dependent enzyme [Citricoccus sp.]
MTTPQRARFAEDALSRRATKVMTRGNTRSTLFVPPAPPYAVRGEGAHIVDQLGGRVIDANNNYTSLIHGHAHPRITAAVAEVVGSGTAFGLPTEQEVELAELLSARTGQERWRFSNSGTEAVMTAVRAARSYTGRGILIRFEGSYHGTSDAVVSRTAPGITAGVRSDVVVLPQGNVEAFDEVIAEHGDRVAAVLIDLMPNRAGLVPADPAFVEHIREATRAVGALMIVDEVISLRLSLGGLAAEYGADPDLITAGKIIGGGFPIGAVGGRADVLAVFDPLADTSVGWGGTFSANPVSMTAGRVAMQLFDAEAVQRLNGAGDRLRESLLAAGVAVTGRGSLMRLREPGEPADLWWAAYERGVMIGTNGLISLSTAMTEQDLATIERSIVKAAEQGRR